MAYLLLLGTSVGFLAMRSGWAAGTTGEGVPQGLVPTPCLLLWVISSNCDTLILVFPVSRQLKGHSKLESSEGFQTQDSGLRSSTFDLHRTSTVIHVDWDGPQSSKSS